MDGTRLHDNAAARAVAAVALFGIGLIHLLASLDEDAAYIRGLYFALIAGSAVVALWLLHRDSPRAWAAGGVLAAAVIVGYVLSRTTGLPAASDDVGDWSNPLGVASLYVEGGMVALAVYRLGVLPRLGTAPAADEPRRRDVPADRPARARPARRSRDASATR